LIARTPHTLVDPSALRDDVKLTRRQGYVLSIEDVTRGMGALGAPIRDRSGRVVAALSIADLRHTYDGEALPGLISLVSAAAARSSQALGYKGSAASA
jgi:DNA-binding IclR family transcriptional regulator